MNRCDGNGGNETEPLFHLASGPAELTGFQWGIIVLLAAMVLWLFTLWGRRMVLLRRQWTLLENWARTKGYAFEPKPEMLTAGELLPFGSEASGGNLSARLFAGFAGRPPMWAAGHVSYRWLLTSSGNAVDNSGSSRDIRIWESREVTGGHRRPAPTTSLGTVVRTRFSTLAGVALSRDVPTLLITPLSGPRMTLNLHRRLRIRTGDKSFDRRFAVLALAPESIHSVLDERMRSHLLREGIPRKTSLVCEGRTCYASGYGLLTPDGLDERIALIQGVRRLLEAQEPAR